MTFNPFDPSQLDDPYDALRDLRRSMPVSEPMPGLSLVVRYEDVRAMAHDISNFPQAGFTPFAERDPEEMGLGELDPPRHSEIRKLLLTALGPSKVRQARSHVERIARELISSTIAASGSVDVVEELAKPLPTRVVAHMIGVPEVDADRFRAWSDEQVARLEPTQGNADIYHPELVAYLHALIERVRVDREQSETLTARMLAFRRDDGTSLTDREIVSQLVNVIVGGTETTTHLIGNLLYELCLDADLYQRLRADRSLVADAIEESLRHVAPVQFLFRRTDGPTVVGDERIASGFVALSLASANRDEAVFTDPDAFDIDRDRLNDHLAFGHGIHFCVGAQLARMEVAVAMNAFLDRVAAVELAPGYEYQRTPFAMMRGPQRLEVSITPSSEPEQNS